MAGQPLYVDPESDYVCEVLDLASTGYGQTVCCGTDGAVRTELRKLLGLGPGDMAQAHTQDEWVQLDQLKRGSWLYAELIHRWCL